jgi:hypothetical protein
MSLEWEDEHVYGIVATTRVGKLRMILGNTIRMGRREKDNEDGKWLELAQVHIHWQHMVLVMLSSEFCSQSDKTSVSVK